MIAIDTNVLVRVLTDDDESPIQTQLARQLVQREGCVYIPQIVQVELVWVLERAYELDKTQIIHALTLLKESSLYQLQSPEKFDLALQRFATNNAGFADALIATESEQSQLLLWTFDRKLSKQNGVQLLSVDSLSI
ncbi:MAG: type II toxin-antitoxin system VapC family toxin [Moraxellaceae bacterium]|nr:type II toxin-antitoxin system VapC family toxin [Pseudomonadales bacterium]MCP5174231.1 type II toxin-antitoxin system VapC family toxin [Moraxellaceae bacterium]MCP5176715.1 type II toxin-antitoxin system VapC family toxin [Moraxellaceae bacterium]